MRKYPIGLQDFGEIRKGGFLYIDKTHAIYNLIESGKYYFLSRPRRFGKSLLLSTIKEIFSGNKKLFEGLWIENQWNWEKKHPVIHLRLSKIDYQKFGLYEALNMEMVALAKELDIELEANNLKGRFEELIRKASVNENVVILIDEYDKPIIDYLDDLSNAEENRAVFKSFYSILKDSDEYIRLLLITGVSRFTKVSIFSDLNNLRDITLLPQFETLTGITQEELDTNFKPELAELSAEDASFPAQIKEWYNGYSWGGKTTAYNPFSILNFMADRQFNNYWIATGTPSFLIKQVRSRPDFLFTEDNLEVDVSSLSDLYIDNIKPLTLMFQTGYLTIKSYNKEDRLYTLGYPNREVKESVLAHLATAYSFTDTGHVRPTIIELKKAFTDNNIKKVVDIIDTLLANIPNPLWIDAKESFYHGLIHTAFQLLGIEISSEVHSAKGRLDARVMTKTHIYVLEFKLDATAQHALDQIINKDYLGSYKLDPRKKVAIGINFSSAEKKISEYLIQEF
ncbi:PD-(D/E)XK nuclease superfamily protein [Chitinophaga sp. CF118]|uniref:ATP-binding protein n=1 Tax=Chitinophaga sp. CF118 TaxID=1884367 RepID=UPI0008E89823|nr:ATP-binding protein [Chitinophaga sp. CF118]SFE31877.1 PD-(D/E)XK nuclease superfamily protein [Chitinophaga sp. CF118]